MVNDMVKITNKMITNTIQGCSYTELWVSPANWQKATKKRFGQRLVCTMHIL